jgi:hypothetical protein
MLEERLNYFLFSLKKIIFKKSVSYEEAIKEYAAKKCRKKVLQMCVRHLSDKKYCYLSGFCSEFHLF